MICPGRNISTSSSESLSDTSSIFTSRGMSSSELSTNGGSSSLSCAAVAGDCVRRLGGRILVVSFVLSGALLGVVFVGECVQFRFAFVDLALAVCDVVLSGSFRKSSVVCFCRSLDVLLDRRRGVCTTLGCVPFSR